MTNSASDINVPANFQPMLKRYKIWNKVFGQFATNKAHLDGIYDMKSIAQILQSTIADSRALDNYIFLQSTGLKDKNGKEIFEGDIVKYFDEVLGYAHYDEDVLGWRVLFTNGDWDDLYELKSPSLEVVGNVLETPELLEGGNHD